MLNGMTRRGFVGTAALGAVGMAATGRAADAAPLSAAEQSVKKVVDDFCAAWKTGDASKAASHLAETCVVRFTASTDGSPALSGRAAVQAQIAKYLTGMTIEFMVKDTWVSGPMVMNRRVDRIVSPKGTQDIAVVGVFFVRDGKIKEWSDFIVEGA